MEEQRIYNPEMEAPETENPEVETPEAEILEEENQKPVYRPRPSFQVWAARIGLFIVILGIILYYWHIATGGN